jgi:hypothetical protein
MELRCWLKNQNSDLPMRSDHSLFSCNFYGSSALANQSGPLFFHPAELFEAGIIALYQLTLLGPTLSCFHCDKHVEAPAQMGV